MRVLIFHGYLLGGTGSNVYNARLAAALVALGHEVHLLCQDRRPEDQAFVDAVGDWDGADGVLRVRALREPVRCTTYRPDIGGLLPVYVMDRYEGIQARTFADCSEEQVERYIAANVAAVREVVELVQPEVALANHLVMGPVILARALAGGVPYAVKVHGSALEYTVKPRSRALPELRARGAGGRQRRAGGLSSHRRQPVGGAGGLRAAGAHSPRPARRRHRALRTSRACGGGAGRARAGRTACVPDTADAEARQQGY